MNVLVTGGAGFIGHHLVNRLRADNHAVWVVDNLRHGSRRNVSPDAHFCELDICSAGLQPLVRQVKPDVVYHLAAQSSVPNSVEYPIYDAQVNVIGTINLLEACAQAGVRKVIFSHTSAVYAEAVEGPVNEFTPAAPQSPYGVSKWCALHYLDLYHQQGRLDYTALCYANVYGPGQRCGSEGGVIATFLQHAMAGQAPSIFGDGRQTRDFVFVDDVVEANLLAASRASGMTINIGTGKQCSILELWSAIEVATGFQAKPVHTTPRPGDVCHQYMNIERAIKRLGWRPQVPMMEGLTAMYLDLCRQLEVVNAE